MLEIYSFISNVIYKNYDLPPSGRFWLSCLFPLVYLLLTTFKLFGFPMNREILESMERLFYLLVGQIGNIPIKNDKYHYST
jgi:hypothetical protein